jgi:hypothetical protein
MITEYRPASWQFRQKPRYQRYALVTRMKYNCTIAILTPLLVPNVHPNNAFGEGI